MKELNVVKRSGKKVPFNPNKIALAIKKAFDSVDNDNYTLNDVNKVHNSTCDRIDELRETRSNIRIYEIQNIIIDELNKNGYADVAESFLNYRNKRDNARDFMTAKQGKLMKALEGISQDAEEVTSKKENANVDGNSAMGTMLQYGSAISKEVAKAYFMDKRFADAHDEGRIHIHDMDFVPMGTLTCCQIPLDKLFAKGFSTGHGYLRTPNDIISYAALAAIAIQSDQNDQHGGQSIPNFDYYMAPRVLKTFKKHLKQTIYDSLDILGILEFINFKNIEKDINAIESMDITVDYFEKYCTNDTLKVVFEKSIDKAVKKTDRSTYQAMEAFVHNLNSMHSRAGAQVPFSSINLGTDTTTEGRMVIKNLLLATDSGLGKGETPIFPISIFKVEEGINYNPEDPNYDLFRLACKVSAKRLFPNFSFLDAPFNLQYYKPGNPDTEIAYMGCRTRVIGNVHDPKREIVTGRGNLSFTSINLPRLGLKYGIVHNPEARMDDFYAELDECLEMVKDQLLERMAIQGNKHVTNFPFLMGQGVWIDSKGMKPNDKLKKVIKHGTLTAGFIGLAECLVALTGKHHGESEESQKLGLEIVGHMRAKMDEYSEKYKLNFSLIATPAEGLSFRFTRLDKAIFGEVPGVTDREYYTNSFHIPVWYSISAFDKIRKEAPYHALTNAGHISYVELDGDTAENTVAFTSADSTTATAWTDVAALATGEKHSSIFNKVSTMFKNIRFLYKMLGTTDISAIGDGTVTNALSTLNSNLETEISNCQSAIDNLGGFPTFVPVDEIFFDFLNSCSNNTSVAFSNWTDNTNFPELYGSGIFFACADPSIRIVIYITGNKMHFGKYLVLSKTISWHSL